MMSEAVLKMLSSLAARIAIVVVFFKGIFNERWRKTLDERCGYGAWLDEVWHEKDVIWFHGASVGETVGLQPLIKEVKKKHPESFILVTTTSTSGQAEAKKREIGDKAILFPLDHPRYIERVLEVVKPRLVVITETELWPNFLFITKEKNIPTVLVNGRISDYTFPRYYALRFLFKPLIRSFQKILVQSQKDAERFIAIGAEPEKVLVVGSTKYSQQVQAMPFNERAKYAESLGIDVNRPCFVAGSVRTEEDELVIKAYLKAKKEVPELQMLIAPRHAQRFMRVARLLTNHKIKFNSRSKGAAREKRDVVLLDTIGELSYSYALGSFAFVGGSLVDIGGHNPFEPAAQRVMVLFGPHTGNVRTVVEDLEAKGGLFVVKNENDLAKALIRLAKNPDECLARGTRAYDVWKVSSSAVSKVLPVVESFIKEDFSGSFSKSVQS